jgi:hypothetical protein
MVADWADVSMVIDALGGQIPGACAAPRLSNLVATALVLMGFEPPALFDPPLIKLKK